MSPGSGQHMGIHPPRTSLRGLFSPEWASLIGQNEHLQQLADAFDNQTTRTLSR
jgi:hypothetical protein